MDITTNQAKAFVSNFDKDEITKKIYALATDPDAIAYQNQQAALLAKALKEDGFI